MIGTSSIDTTCTIWDVNKECVKTQLIAHDKSVYDISFANDVNTFASAGQDGSIRHFDLRELEHSTIIFESQELPLLRVAWNRHDPNYLATIMYESNKVVILDIRMPQHAVITLSGHTSFVNSICWAPHSSAYICTAGDDSNVLIWDIKKIPDPVEEPMLTYQAEGEVSCL